MNSKRRFIQAAIAAAILSLILSQTASAMFGLDDIVGAVLWVIGKAFAWVLKQWGEHVLDLSDQIPKILRSEMLGRPQVNAGSYLMMAGLIMKLVLPLLAFAIIYTAIKMIFSSATPGERSEAKNQLQALLFGLIVIPVSPHIFQILIDISYAITMSLLGGYYSDGTPVRGVYMELFPDPVNPDSVYGRKFGELVGSSYAGVSGWQFIFIFCCSQILALNAVTMLFIRLLAVGVMAVLMPLTVFLYLFDFTKTIGRKFMKFSITWALVPVIASLWVLVAGVLLVNLGAPSTGLDTNTGTFLAVGFLSMIVMSPLMIVGFLDTVGAVLASAGQLMPGVHGAAAVAAGQLLRAKSAEALVMAGMQAGAGVVTSKLKGLKGGAKGLESAAKTGGQAAGSGAAAGAKGIRGAMVAGVKTAGGAIANRAMGMAGGKVGQAVGAVGRGLGAVGGGLAAVGGAIGTAANIAATPFRAIGQGIGTVARGAGAVAGAVKDRVAGVGRSIAARAGRVGAFVGGVGRAIGSPFRAVGGALGRAGRYVAGTRLGRAISFASKKMGLGAGLSLMARGLAKPLGMLKEDEGADGTVGGASSVAGMAKGAGKGLKLGNVMQSLKNRGGAVGAVGKALGSFRDKGGLMGMAASRLQGRGGRIGRVAGRYDRSRLGASGREAMKKGQIKGRGTEAKDAVKGVGRRIAGFFGRQWDKVDERVGGALLKDRELGGRKIPGLASRAAAAEGQLGGTRAGRVILGLADAVAEAKLGRVMKGVIGTGLTLSALNTIAGMSAVAGGGGLIPGLMGVGISMYAAKKGADALGLGKGLKELLQTPFGMAVLGGFTAGGMVDAAGKWGAMKTSSAGEKLGFRLGRAAGLGLDLGVMMASKAMVEFPMMAVETAMTGGLNLPGRGIGLAGKGVRGIRTLRDANKAYKAMSSGETIDKSFGKEKADALKGAVANKTGKKVEDVTMADVAKADSATLMGVAQGGAFAQESTGKTLEMAKDNYEKANGKGSWGNLGAAEQAHEASQIDRTDVAANLATDVHRTAVGAMSEVGMRTLDMSAATGMRLDVAENMQKDGWSVRGVATASQASLAAGLTSAGFTGSGASGAINASDMGAIQKGATGAYDTWYYGSTAAAADAARAREEEMGATGTYANKEADAETSITPGEKKSDENMWLDFKNRMAYAPTPRKGKTSGEQLEEMLFDRDERPSR